MREQGYERLKELTGLLREAGRVYYQESGEIMSNFEYDRLYDELQSLEEELGITLSGSPTANVGYEVLSELPKERHESRMLSLDKTKETEGLKEFLGEKRALMSWKLDGLTIVLTYRGGKLYKAVTRGNGEVGEVITSNAKVFKNIPLQISFKGELILRGEAVISYRDFEKINDGIEEAAAKYKNPRNLCSGSVRQLNNEVTAKRNVRFYAFSLVQADGVDFSNSRACQMEWLKSQGFEVVEYHIVERDTVEQEVRWFSEKISGNEFPSDGLVLVLDDIAYGRSLGQTAKFPRDSIAFKWADETRMTELLEIEWSPSRTGLINPVAIFRPVELEGTTVSRASVHNISIMEELELGVGDEIEVYKANMIIPQIARNLTRSGIRDIPKLCPVCQGRTEVQQVGNAKALYCMNPECQAKHIKAFSLFASRDALNIEGLSEATLEKFVARGFIREFSDIFHLERYSEEIKGMEGFGEKSYRNLIASIEKARVTTLPKVIYGLGIAGIGLANAKVICREFHNDADALIHADEESLNSIDGIGGVLAGAFVSYFKDENHIKLLLNLLKELEIPEEIVDNTERVLEGKKFVITGSVTHFANRGEVKELIESLGGKVTGSVTAKTDFLINNDVNSASSKNKKANELNVPIISEEEFIRMTRKAD
ncbi:MAG: NAD-dependent DNA ligase LigA [Dorea sp.]|jgi:DNA ligase (NAD+)|nr:NAD-dependent DNA ligase LigA [Dorea sp.]